MAIVFDSKKVVRFLGATVVCLIIANMVGVISKYYFGFSRIALFELDREANVPTLYSSVTLLLCASLLAVIGVAKKRQGKREYLYWLVLALIFLFLSVDETAGLHERMISPLRAALHTSGILYFAWVVPYGILLLIMTGIYFRFIFSLAVWFRYLIVFAGFLYIAGAFGGELVGGYWTELHGQEI